MKVAVDIKRDDERKGAKKATLVVRDIAELVTLKGAAGPGSGKDMKYLGIIRDGAVAVSRDAIVAVGSTEEVMDSIAIDNTTKIIGAKDKTVTPGFVDPHTHLVFAGSRENELMQKIEGASYMDILAKGGGIMRTVGMTRTAEHSTLIGQAKKRLDYMLAFGTTTAEAKSGYGLDTVDELKLLEVIKVLDKVHPIDLVPTFLGAHAIPREYKERPEEYIGVITTKMLSLVRRKNLAEFCDVFCEKGVFSVDQSRQILLEAKRYGFKIKIHADEIENIGAADLAAELGATSADHLVKTTPEQMSKLAQKGVVAVLLPGTTFSLMEDEYANAREMIKRGLPVALATDLNPNCYTESMPFIMSLACLKMKMTPAEALTASTINAAYAIQRGNLVGSIEPKKRADLVVLDCPNHVHIPYRFGSNLVETVIKNGEVVYSKSPRVLGSPGIKT